MPALPTILTLPARSCNSELSLEITQRIISLRDELERRAPYNTLDAALDLCDRAAVAAGPKPFAEAHARGPSPFDAAFVQAKGSNCFGMAQLLCARLKQDFDLEAYAVARPGRSGVVSLWPALTHPGKAVHEGLLASLDGIIHVDVAVPMRAHGELTVLTLFCGGGPAMPAERFETPKDNDWLAQLRLVPDPQLLQHRAITGAHKLYLSDIERGCTFGIDLFRGLMFLSQNAFDESLHHGDPTGQACAQVVGRNFNFGQLLAREAMATLDEDDEEIASVAGEWQLCRQFLGQVAALFGRDKDLVTRTEHLMRHWREYGAQVLVAPFTTLRGCINERDAAMDAGSALLALIDHWDLTAPKLIKDAQRAIDQAAHAVDHEQAYLAKALYQQAKDCYSRVSSEVAQCAENALANRPQDAAALSTETVTQLPTEVFVRCEQTLRKVDPSGTQFARIFGHAGAQRTERLRHLTMTL